MNAAPILSPSGPFLGDIYHCQVQHFQQAVVDEDTDLALVTLRSWRLKLSMALVVYFNR